MSHSVIKTAVSTTALLIALSPAAVLSADGEELYQTKTCSTCHGWGHANYIGANNIKSGTRSNGQSAAMKGVMHLVSEEELQALAEYISTMEP